MASAVEDTDKWVRLFLGEPDILRRILRSLPKWKDVLNCRLVCRQWMEEIEKDQDFWERMLVYGKTELSKTMLLIDTCKTQSPTGVAVLIRRGFDVNASFKVIPEAPFRLDFVPFAGFESKPGSPLEAVSCRNIEGEDRAQAIGESCKIAELLLQNGASVNSTPEGENHPMVQGMVGYGQGPSPVWNGPRSPLFRAVQHGNIELAQLLIKSGADVNEGKLTPLSEAVFRRDVDMTRLLIQNGADVNKDNVSGDRKAERAPLTNAILGSWILGRRVEAEIEIVKLLVENGANVNHCWKRTPLTSAILEARIDIVKLLIEKGADVNKNDKGDGTPLQITASVATSTRNEYFSGEYLSLSMDSPFTKRGIDRSDILEIAKILLENGAEVDGICEGGPDIETMLETPLMMAKDRGNKEMVELLIEHGANNNPETSVVKQTTAGCDCCEPDDSDSSGEIDPDEFVEQCLTQ